MRELVRLGFLYPSHSGESDYEALAKQFSPTVRAVVVHTNIAEDAHEEKALREMGASHRLVPAALELRDAGVSVVVWACTSGSFVFGLEGARRQASVLADKTGLPASSTSLAFVDALQTMRLKRVALAATYPTVVTEMFERFLLAGGLSVISVRSLGIMTGVAVGELPGDKVIELALACNSVEAEAILIPDTALHTGHLIEDLESALGKPVLTANQVTMWQALRLAGHLAGHQSMGTLFRQSRA
jgi:maleate cis-trans isomerase